MKLVIALALVALATARPNFDTFEPIQVGPALVDFQPEQQIGSIDKEAVIAFLRRILERLQNLRPIQIGAEPVDIFEPIHIGAEPVDIFEPIHIGAEPIDDLDIEGSSVDLDRIREIIERIFGILGIEVSRPPAETLEAVREWFRRLLERLVDSGISHPSWIPTDIFSRILQFILRIIRRLWPHGTPDSLLPAVKQIIEALRNLFPNGVPRPPRPTPESINSIMEWVRSIIDRFLPHVPKPPGNLFESLLEFVLDYIRERFPDGHPSHIPSTLQELIDFLRDLFDRHWPRHLAPHPEPPVGSIEAIIDWTYEGLNQIRPVGTPNIPRPPTNTLEILINWIKKIIRLLEGQQQVVLDPVIVDNIKPTKPIPAPSSSPLVQIIVNVRGTASDSVVSPVVVDEPTPVDVAEDAQESEFKPTPVTIIEESEVKPEQVVVVDELGIGTEPVIISPVIVAPAVVAPDTLN